MTKPTTYPYGYDSRFFRPDYLSWELWNTSGKISFPPFGDRITMDSREVKTVQIGTNVSRSASYTSAGYGYTDTMKHPKRWTAEVIEANADTFEKMRYFFENIRLGAKVKNVRLSGILDYVTSSENTQQINELWIEAIVSFPQGDWLTNRRGRGHQKDTPFALVFEETTGLSYPTAPVTGTVITAGGETGNISVLTLSQPSFFGSSK